jgi:hypothetical protein
MAPVLDGYLCRPLEEYFDFLEDAAPGVDEPFGSRRLVDTVFEL